MVYSPSHTAARALVVGASVVTIAGALLADFVVPATARQHLRNPRWPAHAKFHNAQYIVMNAILGSIGLGLVVVDRGDQSRRLTAVAAAVVATPWLGMYGATLFPGTALVDEEFADLPHNKILGIDTNIAVASICLAILGAATGLLRSSRCVTPGCVTAG